MGRLNRPALMVYGGTIRPGLSKLTGDSLNIVDAFQSYGEFAADKITEEQRADKVCCFTFRFFFLPFLCQGLLFALALLCLSPSSRIGAVLCCSGCKTCTCATACSTKPERLPGACRCASRAPARARAAACIRPTPWPLPSRRSA